MQIWNIDCPPKVRIALWRARKTYLPTMKMLNWRRIAPNTNFPRCHLPGEDVDHVFRHCFFAMEVWLALGYNIQPTGNQLEFHKWLSWLFDSYNISRHKELAITIWALWSARRKILYENELQGVGHMITFIRGYCGALNNFSSITHSGCSLVTDVWCPPPLDWVKINVDASFILAQNKSGSGVIIRNSFGEIMAACCNLTWLVLSVFMAEAKAVVHGLKLVADLGFQHLIIESDSRSIITKINSKQNDMSEISALTWEAKAMARQFHSRIYQFVGREGNRAAHLVAREGIRGASNQYWIEDGPQAALQAVDEDRRRIDPPKI